MWMNWQSCLPPSTLSAPSCSKIPCCPLLTSAAFLGGDNTPLFFEFSETAKHPRIRKQPFSICGKWKSQLVGVKVWVQRRRNRVFNKEFGFQDLPWVTTSMTKFSPLGQNQDISRLCLDFARKVCQKQTKTGVKSYNLSLCRPLHFLDQEVGRKNRWPGLVS